jgi:hypothetical protein
MRRRWTIAVVVAFVAIGAAVGYAQQIFSGYYGYTPPRYPTANSFKGAFNMCRLQFTSNRREKRGWDTDYPGADINFSVRLAELTRTRVTKQPNHTDPEYVVVRTTDQALFQCPFILLEDAGTAVFSDQEVKQLREYFLKGGFAFVSDYWGPLAKEQFDDQIGRVLPHDTYPIIDLPMDHPIWHTQFELTHLPQMSSIQSWRRTGGGTTERGVMPGTQSARAVVDQKGRVMVVMVHNDDIPDGWEREGEEHEYFVNFSPDAYSVGIDVLLYALTH